MSQPLKKSIHFFGLTMIAAGACIGSGIFIVSSDITRNVPSQLELARRLAQRGRDRRVMSDQCHEADVRAAGSAFVAYTHAPSGLIYKEGMHVCEIKHCLALPIPRLSAKLWV